MRRSVALIGSCCAALALALAPIASAAAPTVQTQAALRIVNAPFVGAADPSLRTLLQGIGARLTWRNGQRDVLITRADHVVVAFTVGSELYHAGGLTLQARYAPYLHGAEPFLPLSDVLSALSLRGFPDGRVLLVEPLLASLDVRSSGGGATVIAAAGVPLVPTLVARDASSITYAFTGVGSSVSGTREVDAGGIRDVAVQSTGQLASARTLLTIDLARGATALPAQSDDGRDFSLSVIAARGQTPAPPGPRVTAVDVLPSAGAFTVAVAVTGDATYAWHRLAQPDNRFWLDVKGATLVTAPRDDHWIGRVTGVRVDQVTPQRVRVALSLAAEQSVSVVPSATGVRIVVGDAIASGSPRAGNGSIGSVVSAVVAAPLATPQPAATALLTPVPMPNRPSSVATNPRLIVIDPGHGGNDPGTSAHGLLEKTVTLDIALRLRGILVARGWQVRMTRSTDTEADPAATTDRDELQARVDDANDNGARAFVSIHVNWYSEPDPNGVTSYYSKPQDVALARDVENAVAREAGVTNRGIVKSALYVTLHTRMPAVLIETAFISNPGDFARLDSPQWRQRVALGIADGIETYARENPLPPAPTN